MRELAHHQYTLAEYFSIERDSTVKHEFFDGEIYAMAGGTEQHAQLSVAVVSSLYSQLRDRPCRPLNSDFRIAVAASGLVTYPDASVICGPTQTDPQFPNAALNPTVIVEVLSPSTERYDRGAKFDHYKRLRSAREYVLVSHREPLIEVFRRRDSDDWERFEARIGSAIRLESVDCALSVDEIYKGIDLAGG